MKEFKGKTTNDRSIGLLSSRKTERNHPLECDGTRPASKCSFLLKSGWLVVAFHSTDSFGNFFFYFFFPNRFTGTKKIDIYLYKHQITFVFQVTVRMYDNEIF